MPRTSTARIKSAEAQLDKKIHEFWAADIVENISTVRNHLLNSKLPGEFVLSSMHDVLMLIQFTQSIGSVKEQEDMMDKIYSKI